LVRGAVGCGRQVARRRPSSVGVQQAATIEQRRAEMERMQAELGEPCRSDPSLSPNHSVFVT